MSVGDYHLLRHNFRGATNRLESGANYLQPFAPRCMGMEVGRLIVDARRLRTELVPVGPERFEEIDLSLLPMVRFAGENHISPARDPS